MSNETTRINYISLLQRFQIILIAIMATTVIWQDGYADELYPEVSPNPAYTAREVVGIQMRALRKNNIPHPNAGIELTFRFASPDNLKSTGPFERFLTLFENPAYQPMLNYSTLEIGESTASAGSSLVPVIITDSQGKRAAYLFTLSQQTQSFCELCWMTDRVVRVRLPNSSSTIL